MNNKRKLCIVLMRGLMVVSTVLTVALVLFLMSYVLVKGLPNISWELLSTKPSYITERIGILPDILNTVYIVLNCGCNKLGITLRHNAFGDTDAACKQIAGK